MIQKLINNECYEFEGNINDLKRSLRSFKILSIIKDKHFEPNIWILEIEGAFRYHGQEYKIYIEKNWIADKLYISRRG